MNIQLASVAALAAAFALYADADDVTAGTTPEQVEMLLRADYENGAPVSCHGGVWIDKYEVTLQ